MSSEEDIIRNWLKGLFMRIENAEDVEVKDFQFGPLEDKSNTRVIIKGRTYKSLAVLRQVSVTINVMNVEKDYSLILKVLPTDDNERYSIKHKFKQLLRFSKEVQVYMEIVNPMFSVCKEKQPQLKFSSPPVAEVFLGQMDALNDCLVLENLSKRGFVKYKEKINEPKNNNSENRDKKCDNDKEVSELISHCNIVLQNVAKFHALSLVIRRLEGQALSEKFPFAVEGEGFRQDFKKKMLPLRETLLDYSKGGQQLMKEDTNMKHIEASIDKKIHEMFWILLGKKSRPMTMEKEVLIHGNLDFSTVMFKYEHTKPFDCKFLDLSHVSVSSPVMDIIIFLYSVMSSNLIETCHLSFLLTYHSALMEFCHQLDITEGIISLEELLKDFNEKKIFGKIMSCQVEMAKNLLKMEVNEDVNADADAGDASTLYISTTKSALFLQHVEDTCKCPTHSEKTRPDGKLSEYKNLEKTGKTNECEGAFVSFIKSASLSPRLRNIL